MAVEVAAVFKAASFGHAAAKYFGIVSDKLAAKLDQLVGSEFEAGMRALEQAVDSQTEQHSLLREARSRFNKAVSLENGVRLALVHLGLAVCHFHLGDRINAKRSLEDLVNIKPPEPTMLQRTTFLLSTELGVLASMGRIMEYRKLREFQQAVRAEMPDM